ncbi:MAG: HDIG domain-containing metalloprotein [Thermoguttaceae bacterium]
MTSPKDRVRTREQRVAAHVDYNGFIKRIKKLALEDNGFKKLRLLLATSVVITILCGSWDPPLKFKLFSTPDRDIVCNTDFRAVDEWQTSENRNKALENTPHYYAHAPGKLAEYKRQLASEMQTILGITDLSHASPEQRKTLLRYLSQRPTLEEERHALEKFQTYFEEDVDLANFRSALDKALMPFEEHGVVKEIKYAKGVDPEFVKVFNVEKEQNFARLSNANSDNQSSAEQNEGKASSGAKSSEPSVKSEDESVVARMDRALDAVPVRLPEVLFSNGLVVRNQLNDIFAHDRALVDLIFDRIRRDPPETLKEDLNKTKLAQAEEVGKVQDFYREFHVGNPIVRANQIIGPNEYRWLASERKSYLSKRLFLARLIRFCAALALNTLLLLSAYFIIISRRSAQIANSERNTLRDLRLFLLSLVIFIMIGRSLQVTWSNRGMLTELAPLVTFVELSSFTFSWVVALTASVLLSLVLTISGGGGLDVFIPLCGTSVFVAFAVRIVRTRLQLVLLAFYVGLCAFFLSLASSLMSNDFMRPGSGLSAYMFLSKDFLYTLYMAFFHGLWAFMGGVLTNALLPMVEQYLNVVTPIKLLEYANPSVPLMVRLNQVAQATYNHSIQTSYLAEAAAEAIGARSYLVKVGAYFHDVGKTLKPEYFTENQVDGYNIHDEIEPRISALVIASHVKDGVELGLTYNLPREIIDLIQQHHGTMFVGRFYQRALKAAQEKDPEARLDEGPYRYPGPIPQSKEAGILMLADAVESASRSALTDWSPRRVENLVRKITEARIADGQFRESGLTFGEVQTIQQSLVASLLASHHTRVKYSEDGPKTEKDGSQVVKSDKSSNGDSQAVKSDKSSRSDAGKKPKSETSSPNEDGSQFFPAFHSDSDEPLTD